MPSGKFKRFEILKEIFLQNRWNLIAGIISLIIVDLLQLIIPLIIKRAVDGLTNESATLSTLFHLGLYIVIISLFIAIFRYLWRYFLFGHARLVEERIRNRLYSHIQSLPLGFFSEFSTGDIMARFINDLNAIRMATGMGLVALIDGFIMSLLAIGFMLSISVKLTIISLTPAPIIILFSKRITKRMSVAYEKVQRQFSFISERVREIFSSIRIIKAYGREDWSMEMVRNEGGRYVAFNMEVARAIGLFFPMMALFTNLGLSILIFWGGRLTILNDITTGDFVAFIGYLNLLSWPMMAAGWVVNLLRRGAVSVDRINKILKEKPEILRYQQSNIPKKIKGDITIQNLSFRYPERMDFALKDVNLHITEGSSSAIVGRVGAGKSTLISAIMRLIPIKHGTVFIDGVDINTISLNELRSKIKMVTQEPVIYSDTILNNLLLGREGIYEDNIYQALSIAQILDEVLNLKDGLNTVLGEKGINLSGGQKQRLCLARAIIQMPEILILDDPLSMVDVKTESMIISALMEQRSDKTTIVVSNRPSTLTLADIIFVMENGTITGSGSHNELIVRHHEYKKLYQEDILIQELERMS